MLCFSVFIINDLVMINRWVYYSQSRLLVMVAPAAALTLVPASPKAGHHLPLRSETKRVLVIPPFRRNLPVAAVHVFCSTVLCEFMIFFKPDGFS